MVTPLTRAAEFGSDAAASSSKEDSPGNQWLSWLGADDSAAAPAAPADNTNYALGNTSVIDATALLRQEGFSPQEMLKEQRSRFRAAILPNSDYHAEAPPLPGDKATVPTVTLVDSQATPAGKLEVQQKANAYVPTDLRLTNDQQEVATPQIGATPENAEFWFERRGSAATNWLTQNRPDLVQEFQAPGCTMVQSWPAEGGSCKRLTSAAGNTWMITSKGGAEVEVIADRSGGELFKQSSRPTRQLTA